nr:hypothetical protein [Frankia sp. Cas4]
MATASANRWPPLARCFVDKPCSGVEHCVGEQGPGDRADELDGGVGGDLGQR